MRFWLSAVFWNFPQGNSQKVLTFRGLPFGKTCLSTVWSAKVKTFRGFYHWEACLHAEKSAESFDFPRIIPRKGMPFRGIIQEKFWLSPDYPRKVKLRARISPPISWKNIKQFLDVHQGPIRCWLMIKNETKKSHATVPWRRRITYMGLSEANTLQIVGSKKW